MRSDKERICCLNDYHLRNEKLVKVLNFCPKLSSPDNFFRELVTEEIAPGF